MAWQSIDIAFFIWLQCNNKNNHDVWQLFRLHIFNEQDLFLVCVCKCKCVFVCKCKCVFVSRSSQIIDNFELSSWAFLPSDIYLGFWARNYETWRISMAYRAEPSKARREKRESIKAAIILSSWFRFGGGEINGQKNRALNSKLLFALCE